MPGRSPEQQPENLLALFHEPSQVLRLRSASVLACGSGNLRFVNGVCERKHVRVWFWGYVSSVLSLSSTLGTEPGLNQNEMTSGGSFATVLIAPEVAKHKVAVFFLDAARSARC